jgi:GAF domain-containing protein
MAAPNRFQLLTQVDKPCLEKFAQQCPAAPIPADEKKRLQVLWKYDILDTLPEQTFDDLTELAACICEAPVALITLVDENRQWFKSTYGVSLTEMSRNISFCAHTILSEGLLVVHDALTDIRFADNPLVKCKPNIRFYAGAPLVTKEGQALGTICVLDQVPRDLTPTQEEALRVLARFVVSQLEIRKQSRESENIRAQRDKLEAELDAVRARLAEAEANLARRNN